jgi:3-phosphoshikimate 1-carboxyvinyltransferase
LACLRQLGIVIDQKGSSVMVFGGGRELAQPELPLNCGNSGSTIRMMSGVVAGHDLRVTLTGDSSLSNRPMTRVIEPLGLMGARIDSREGKPPLTVTGTSSLQAIEFEPEVASAQVKSAILVAGLHARGRTAVLERQKTRDHTERLLNWFGVHVSAENRSDGSTRISVTGPAEFAGRDVNIPGDVSSAAYFVAVAALLPDSELELAHVGLNPSRTAFLSMLRDIGLAITLHEQGEECNEPVGTVSVRGMAAASIQNSGPRVVAQELIPQLIDELPLLSVVGSQLPGGITIRGASELRLKESDRITTTVTNLRAMGAQVEEFPDGLSIHGPKVLHGSQLHSYGDHRIAMAFTVAALLAEGESELIGANSVGISLPEFFELLESVVER